MPFDAREGQQVSRLDSPGGDAACRACKRVRSHSRCTVGDELVRQGSLALCEVKGPCPTSVCFNLRAFTGKSSRKTSHRGGERRLHLSRYTLDRADASPRLRCLAATQPWSSARSSPKRQSLTLRETRTKFLFAEKIHPKRNNMNIRKQLRDVSSQPSAHLEKSGME